MEGTGIEERVEAGIEESGREKREGVEAKGTELSEARGRGNEREWRRRGLKQGEGKREGVEGTGIEAMGRWTREGVEAKGRGGYEREREAKVIEARGGL